MAGWAGDVIGAIAARPFGSVLELGNRIGDVNEGHFSLDICARLSTISKVLGHLRCLGYPAGLA